MEQLTGLQNLYLHLESGAAPMHASSLMIYDPGSAPSGKVGFHDIQRFFAERAHRSPVFRRRLVSLPLAVTRPYWVDDAGFDLEFHLRHIALPRPGDWRQLCTQVARLHARPLDRKRPLWECYVIEELHNIPELPQGSFAVFLKTHYAAQGEALSAQLFAALHELAPDSRASPGKEIPYYDRPPTLVDLVSRTAIDTATWPVSITRYAAARVAPLVSFGTKSAGTLVRALRGGHAAQRLGEDPVAPRTRFNGRVSPHRVVDGVAFELDVIERVRDAVPGATVNDVAIAVIGGAMRSYLEGCLEPPAGSLVAEAPLASRSETRIYGTRTFADSAIMSLHTDVEDAGARLALIAAETHRRKMSARAGSGRRLLLEAVEVLPTFALGALGDLAQRMRLGSVVAPIANTTIASIRGPDVPLYMAGARLARFYGFAAVHDLAGLAHAVCYYSGTLSISISACRAMLPDPGRYAQCLRNALADLGDALGVAVARDADPPKLADLHLPRSRSRRRLARPVPAAAKARRGTGKAL